ncbi:unnamed protein product, partial [Brassica rapa subsp. trilocularis]
CLFLVIYKFLFFFMLCFFSQQNLAKPNYLIQNLALMMVLNTKTTGIRSIDFSSMREISLCYILRRRQEAQKNLLEEINHRKQIDQNIIEILRLSLKKTDVLDLLTSTRTTGQPVVDDWDCYKTLVKSFKNQCGAKMAYDMKYAGALANICNMGARRHSSQHLVFTCYALRFTVLQP